MRSPFTLACLGLFAGACAQSRPRSPPAGPPAGAVVYVSADMRGYLGPCGCSENMRGGIARAAFQVNADRKGPLPVLFIDGGDSLFGETHPTAQQVPQEELKAQTLARFFTSLGIVAHGVGELDDARGLSFRRSLGLPDLEPGKGLAIDAKGLKVAVVEGSDLRTLTEPTTRMRDAGAQFVLALFHGPIESAQAAASGLAGPGAPDLILSTHSESPFSAEENRLVRSGVPVVSLQSKGRSLLRVELHPPTGPDAGGKLVLGHSQEETDQEVARLDTRIGLLEKEISVPGIDPRLHQLKQAKRDELAQRRAQLASSASHAPPAPGTFLVRFVPLDSSLPSDPATEQLVAQYDREVGQLNLAWAKAHGEDCPAPASGEPGFVGTAACERCHAAPMAVWKTTRHAQAFATLQEKGKQFHLDCVGCHVTGYSQPGGVCRVDKTQGRENVGCESCHGAGSLHVKAPKTVSMPVRSPDAPQCVGCHNPENSPHFDFARYLPRVLGPGHGEPL